MERDWSSAEFLPLRLALALLSEEDSVIAKPITRGVVPKRVASNTNSKFSFWMARKFPFGNFAPSSPISGEANSLAARPDTEPPPRGIRFAIPLPSSLRRAN